MWLRVGLVALLIGWASLTRVRVQAWENDRTLWTAAVIATPEQPSAWAFLGIAEMQRGCANRAKPSLERAITLMQLRPQQPRDFTRSLAYFWADTASGFSGPPC